MTSNKQTSASGHFFGDRHRTLRLSRTRARPSLRGWTVGALHQDRCSVGGSNVGNELSVFYIAGYSLVPPPAPPPPPPCSVIFIYKVPPAPHRSSSLCPHPPSVKGSSSACSLPGFQTVPGTSGGSFSEVLDTGCGRGLSYEASRVLRHRARIMSQLLEGPIPWEHREAASTSSNLVDRVGRNHRKDAPAIARRDHIALDQLRGHL